MSDHWIFPDEEWSVLEGRIANEGDLGSYRNCMEAAFWLVENEAQWRKLPESYGDWMCAYKRCKKLEKSGLLAHLRRALRKEIEILTLQERIVVVERRVYRRLLDISRKCLGRQGSLRRGRSPKSASVVTYKSVSTVRL